MSKKKGISKETSFSNIDSMCVNASETPFLSYENYVPMCLNN
jgi:hypothetical protein